MMNSLDRVARLHELRNKGSAKAEPAVSIELMPGFSPMQLRAHIDHLHDIQVNMELIRKQYESALAQLKGLEKEEADGVDKLKDAASNL
ncbi:MAG: hypothetical protein WC824_15805, partial [Bacteroidota bacterium]